MVDAYSQIHCLEDIGMIAGSYKVLYIDCYDTDNAAVNLSKATAYGCRFYYISFSRRDEIYPDEVC